jgi:hypothetical protein
MGAAQAASGETTRTRKRVNKRRKVTGRTSVDFNLPRTFIVPPNAVVSKVNTILLDGNGVE